MSEEGSGSPKGFTSRRNKAMAERLGKASIEKSTNRRLVRRQEGMHTEVMPPDWKEQRDLLAQSDIAKRMVHSRQRVKRQSFHTEVMPPNWKDNRDLGPPSHVAERMNVPYRRWLKRQAGENRLVPITRPSPDDDEESDADDDSGAESDESVSSVSSSDEDGVDSGDSSDSDSSDDEDEEETVQSSSTSTAKPTLVTLLPGGPGLAAPAPTSVTESAESISSTALADSSSSSSSSSSVSESTETATNEAPVADADATSRSGLPAATSSSIGSGETADAEADTQQGNEVSDGGMRGRDVGIAIGTLALMALLILGAVIFYKRRNRDRSNASHLDRLDEKNLPPEPPTFRLSTAPPLATGRGTDAAPRTQSSIMDEAMGAAYQHETGGDYEYDEKAGYYGARDTTYDVEKSEIPIGLGINNNNNNYVPPQQDGSLSPGNPFTAQQNVMYQPQPLQTPQPVAAPQQRLRDPYAALQQESERLQPPGRRMSAGGKTEITESSEGTWGTFAVERLRANDGKVPLKERLFGR